MLASIDRLRASYLTALSLVALLTIGAQVVVHRSIARSDSDALLINLSGRQRMLSQRIAKYVLLPRKELADRTVQQLAVSLHEFESAHAALVSHPANSKEIDRAFARLQPHFEDLIRAARSVEDSVRGGQDPSDFARGAVLRAEEVFLPLMHSIVGRYQAETETRVAHLQRIEVVMGVATLLILGLEALLIFEPMRRRVLDALETQRDLRREAIASVDALSMMSHEIRTPLHGVIGTSDLLLETDLTSQQWDLVEMSRRSATNLLALLSQVLDFSKLASGSVEVERVPIVLTEVIDDAVASVANRVDPLRVDLLVDVGPEVPTHFLGDPVRIRQVLFNLVGNAAKFTERGHILVRVECIDGLLGIDVEDTGIGIPDDRLDAIFERFSQAEVTTARRYGGTGLGLWISRELCEAMSGTLTVESSLGGGSTFRVSLPFSPDERRHSPPVKDAADDGAARSPLVTRARVGCVVRSTKGSVVLGDLLGRLGAQYETFDAATNLMDRIERSPREFDLVLLDQHLTGMSISTLVRDLKGREPSPTIIVTNSTGTAEDDEVARFADAHVRKPLTYDRLARTLHEVLDARVPSLVARSVGRRDQRPRALAAEDNPVNRRILSSQLRRLGWDFTIVENGRLAIDQLRKGDFDALLLDIQMPVLDGHSAAREIRAQARWDALVLIAMTADATAEDETEARACGMDSFLAKPFTSEELRSVLGRVETMRHARRLGPEM
ncbi:MAG: ATP-binding protein [Planctomycetota bacterium]